MDAVIFNVQKRGSKFYVNRSSGTVGTEESGPYNDKTAANAAGVAARDAFNALDTTRGLLVHFHPYV